MRALPAHADDPTVAMHERRYALDGEDVEETYEVDPARLVSKASTLRHMTTRAVVQRGPKGKKSVAFALDWPGWSRGAKTPELALEVLASYRERYRPIAASAGLDLDDGPLEVVEDAAGTPSTDFWGISFAPCGFETEPLAEDDLERALSLLRACWTYFDEVAARVSPELQKGPRGGGRDRDGVIGHTLRVETSDFARRVGVEATEEEVLVLAGRQAYRQQFLDALRAYNAGKGKRMRSGNLPFLVRHTAFHTMDHAWELADKDLTP